MVFDSPRELPSSLICHSVVHESSRAWVADNQKDSVCKVPLWPLTGAAVTFALTDKCFKVVGLSLGDRGLSAWPSTTPKIVGTRLVSLPFSVESTGFK